jgi:hypothetical protein
MQVLSGAIGQERAHFEAPPRDHSMGGWRPSWIGSPPRPRSWTGWCARAWLTTGFSPSNPITMATGAWPVPIRTVCWPRTAGPRP